MDSEARTPQDVPHDYTTEPVTVDWVPEDAVGYLLPDADGPGCWIDNAHDMKRLVEDGRHVMTPVGVGEDRTLTAVGLAPMAKVMELETRIDELNNRLMDLGQRVRLSGAMFNVLGTTFDPGLQRRLNELSADIERYRASGTGDAGDDQ